MTQMTRTSADTPKQIIQFKPFQAWIYIVILIHYKPRIAAAILDL